MWHFKWLIMIVRAHADTC